MSDPIADMLTRIRNAGKAKFKSTDIPGSNLKIELAKVLKQEGYIKNYKFTKDGKQGILRVYLKYDQKQTHAIYKIERVSKPSRRVYVKGNDIQSYYNGLGVVVLSTSRGIMTDKRARKENIGGELLCRVY
ncbi:30S ribosomal protein S8 [Desulfobacterales bacterium HSG16]|nr:30S ribosomal protein S8 [Desulfobacterales bacterium HSG16]